MRSHCHRWSGQYCYLLLLYITYLLLPLIIGQPARPPSIKEHPRSLFVKRHEPAQLECKVDGSPPPKIEWYKDGVKVQPSAHRMVLPTSLFFLHVNSKKGDGGGDTGIYYCFAKNAVGEARSDNATLEIALLREEFRVMPDNVQVALGDTATLKCAPPRGRPEPTTSWLRNGQPVAVDESRVKLIGHNLVITDVNQKDQGMYKCVARNMLGVRESPAAKLKVLVKPYFIRPPEDVKAMSDDDVVLHCKVGGDPVPEITWKRLDGKIPIGKSQILEDKALRITRVRPSDEGIYVCEVENTAGRISSSATLAVNSLPSFVSSPKSTQVTAGSVAKFECLATGNPQPLYYWSREGTQVLMFPGQIYGKFNVSSDGILSIQNVDKSDQGFYVCSAVSSVGSAISRAYLSVLSTDDVPPPVIRLGAANQTLPLSTKAFLPCEASNADTIQWFLNHKQIFSNNHFVITENSLQIQRDYTCLASNPSGSTAWRARLAVESPRNPNIHFSKMPDPSMFPEPPSKPFAVNITENSITIKWERFGSGGTSAHVGSMLEYYSPDTRTGWTLVARHIKADVFTVHGLRYGTRYQFIVRAENQHGIGYPSEISDEIKTLDNQNSNPKDDASISQARKFLNDMSVKLKDHTISSTSVKLFWNVEGNLDFVEGFYIRYQSVKSDLQLGNNFNMVTAFGGYTNSYILNDLKKFTQYQFFVVPFFKNVVGNASNILTSRTFEDAPSAPPYSITAKAINSSCAIIEWSPPPEDSRNGHIVGYHVQVFENSTILHANLTVDTLFNSVVLYNLSSESFYTIRAFAFTTVGNGPFSQPIYLNMNPAYDDIHLQPSYPTNFFTQFWFFLFIIIIVIIFAVICIRLLLLYSGKKSKPIYEKANSMQENLSDNFPKYDSGSSKYSSCPDNNEYAEVNDLKNYADNIDKAPVAYAMTPLIEKEHSPASRKQGQQHYDSKYHPGDHHSAVGESLLMNEHHFNGDLLKMINGRANVFPKYTSNDEANRKAFFHRIDGGGNPGGGGGCGDYEIASVQRNSPKFNYDNLYNEQRNSPNNFGHSLPPPNPNTRFHDPSHNSLLDNRLQHYPKPKDNVLSTFQQQQINSACSSPRIITNPISKFDSSASDSSGNDHSANPYLVSDNVSQLSFGSFSSRPSPPIRDEFVFFNNKHSRRLATSGIHDQMTKNKINHKKSKQLPR